MTHFREVEDWQDYTFGCPEGTWTARLDKKAWGKSKNLILYFSEVGTEHKYWFSVFWQNGYRGDDHSLSFKDDVAPGDVLILTTARTRTGNPRLKAAHKISGPGLPQPD